MTESLHDAPERDDPLVDVRMWGKREGLSREYPVICHLLDTAAMAGVLWERMLSARLRTRISNELGMNEEDGRKTLCLWAGLHDIGKISPPFQAKVPVLFARLAGDPAYGQSARVAERERGLRHETATHLALVELFEQLGYPKGRLVRSSVDHQIAQLLGGHHGCFGVVLERKKLANLEAYEPGLGAEKWRTERHAHASAIRQLIQADVAPREAISGPTAAVITGLIVVADWLVSQADVIEPRLPPAGWSGNRAQLERHWKDALAVAPDLARAAGLGHASFPARSFVTQFPFPPNLLQADIAKVLPDLVTGPGLLLITAPTGDGKTEAALHAASVLARASGASGLYFALPTMATADAMYERVKAFADLNVSGDRALTLLHSMAWLNSVYAEQESGSAVVSDQRTGTEATRWLRTGRRGLLAPLGTGTIDQALSAVLPMRYNVLRLLGLSDKVFVVDEAHAYGPWMHSLLLRLLEWLGALRAPVVLLSATLTGQSASSLVEAYRRGAGVVEPAPVQPCYPGWLFVDAATRVVAEPRAVGSNRRRTVAVDVRQVRWDVREPLAAKPGRDSRRAALRELLAPVASEGGCVLVCCTTVEEAQLTYRYLQYALPDLASRDGGLRLLHSRYPAHVRHRITIESERAFGKPRSDGGGETRPGAVLVATQIVEQSLDLDFDLVVSDLAPLAQLLQRAGRGKRHDRRVRPAWTGALDEPRLVVLEPVDGAGSVEVPRSWGSVYDRALLQRTSIVLNRRAQEGIRVPDAVQELVDEVYAVDFGEQLAEAAERDLLARFDAERIASAEAEAHLARWVAVPAPQDVRGDLSRLTSSDPGVTEELLTTRLGADTGRAVCAYRQAGGAMTLDPEGHVRLPGVASVELSCQQVSLIMRHTVPLPGAWLAGRTSDHDVPDSWRRRPMLSELALLPMSRGEGGRWTCELGKREIEISDIGVSTNLPCTYLT
ncbi:CRISPR-associated helicase Cas3' [Kitasatospora acidiphila]|uniref:CRISPR-associated helicase Cas3' n=1 Tax=Kitasatospora acidiphila TaxID=2567942 RepID=UPI003C744A12